MTSLCWFKRSWEEMLVIIYLGLLFWWLSSDYMFKFRYRWWKSNSMLKMGKTESQLSSFPFFLIKSNKFSCQDGSSLISSRFSSSSFGLNHKTMMMDTWFSWQKEQVKYLEWFTKEYLANLIPLWFSSMKWSWEKEKKKKPPHYVDEYAPSESKRWQRWLNVHYTR